ncbi:MAG: nucleoside triphosphate pyrophosphohydrolase [Spirochaetes bacterium]|nr:nucleoside triphosphate pyrophosphohydrolase [Spirochaetota bacterium]
MKSFSDLKEIITKLRSPAGCPWDRKQTHESLIPYLFEETNEVFDALMNQNEHHLKEELGDLLLQVLLHAQIAEENQQFNIDEVVHMIAEKLVRRHPHVFGNDSAENADQVVHLWEQIKQKEKKQNYPYLLDKVPLHFTPLLRSDKLQKEAAKVGFDWSNYKQIISKIEEEVGELKQAIGHMDIPEIEHELGDLFFSIVNLGRFLKIKSDVALAKANKRFYDRFCYIEKKLKGAGKKIEECTLEELDKIWDEAKEKLKRDNA